VGRDLKMPIKVSAGLVLKECQPQAITQVVAVARTVLTQATTALVAGEARIMEVAGTDGAGRPMRVTSIRALARRMATAAARDSRLVVVVAADAGNLTTPIRGNLAVRAGTAAVRFWFAPAG
jgi:hypothetical protein